MTDDIVQIVSLISMCLIVYQRTSDVKVISLQRSVNYTFAGIMCNRKIYSSLDFIIL